MPRMADFRIEHVFNCSQETYWDKVFYDEEYNRRMFFDALGFNDFKVVTEEDTPKGKRRIIDAVPDMSDLPGAIKKVVGDGIGYREEGDFDRSAFKVATKVTPNKLADKISIEGELSTEPAGDDKCKRVFTAKVKVKMFGIGGMMEKRILEDLKDSYTKAAKFTNDFLAEKNLK